MHRMHFAHQKPRQGFLYNVKIRNRVSRKGMTWKTYLKKANKGHSERKRQIRCTFCSLTRSLTEDKCRRRKQPTRLHDKEPGSVQSMLPAAVKAFAFLVFVQCIWDHLITINPRGIWDWTSHSRLCHESTLFILWAHLFWRAEDLRWLVRSCKWHCMSHGSLFGVHRVAEELATSLHPPSPTAPALPRRTLPPAPSSSLPCQQLPQLPLPSQRGHVWRQNQPCFPTAVWGLDKKIVKLLLYFCQQGWNSQFYSESS